MEFEKLLKVQCFYVDSRACVRVGMEVRVVLDQRIETELSDVSIVYCKYRWCGARCEC